MRLPCPSLKGQYLQLPWPSEILQVIFANTALLLKPLTSLNEEKCGSGSKINRMLFSKLNKQALLDAFTLQNPSLMAQIQLNTNASGAPIWVAQRENKEQPWFPVAFYSKDLSSAQKEVLYICRELLAAFLSVKKFRHFFEGRKFLLMTDHWRLVSSLLREKSSDCDRQQYQLSYLAGMMLDFEYVAGPPSAAANALSSLPAEEEADEVCVILPANSQRHWNEKDLLAAQKEDHLTRNIGTLGLNSGFLLGGEKVGLLRLLHRAKPPEVTTRAVLLPPAYRQAAIKALHADTHAGQQQTIKMARDRFICIVRQRVKINKQERVKPGSFPTEKTRFNTVHIDLVGPLPESEGFKYILTVIDWSSWRSYL